MEKVVMICGVDCHKGDDNCNGYCDGKEEHAPEATQEMKIEAAKRLATASFYAEAIGD